MRILVPSPISSNQVESVMVGKSTRSRFAEASRSNAFPFLTRGRSLRGVDKPGAKVNSPGDVHEKEAERAAARVMSVPLSSPGIRGTGKVSGLSAWTQSSRAGRPLDAATRDFFESRLGHDFATVRVHTDPSSARSAERLGASAYTFGQDVVFAHGMYSPQTVPGRALLAHELTHVLQQRQNPTLRSTIQRSITLTGPGEKIPDPSIGRSSFPTIILVPPSSNESLPTKAVALNSWLDILCPDGKWDVDASSGEVGSTDRESFCGSRPQPGTLHHTTSAHPTPCGCLCELTAPDARKVEVQIDEYLTLGDKKISLEASGEGQTSIEPNDDRIVSVSGRSPEVEAAGVGATGPNGDTAPNKTVPLPAWLIFGHELCGHGRIKTELPEIHTTSPGGDVSAVDVENRIRREHSTVESNLGIRRGEIWVDNANGDPEQHFGAAYTVGSGETMSQIAARCGIPAADAIDHVWHFNGDRILPEDLGEIKPGKDLLIEGIDWHQVIRDENMIAIARMWDVPLASLQRANPDIKGPLFTIRPGDRLLIPAS